MSQESEETTKAVMIHSHIDQHRASVHSNTRIISCPLVRWFAIATLALAGAMAANAAATGNTGDSANKRIAFVIGNAKYDNEKVLHNPHNDARLVAQTLKQDLRFDEVIERRDLKRSELFDLITEIGRKSRSADAVVVYYSGHGMRGPGGNYLVPVDARISAEEHIRRDGVPAAELVEALQSSNPRVALLVLDACRDSPYSQRTKSGSKGLARMNVSSGNLLVAYATNEGNTADDGSGSNSPYARALADALKQSKPVLAQLDDVRRGVRQSTNNKQNPTREGDLEVHVYLVNPVITVNPPPMPVTPPRSNPDEEAWKAAIASDVTDGYEQYLKDFPNGRNASAARIKVATATRREQRQPSTPAVGSTFKDCEDCPELVLLPKGSYMMGSPASEVGRYKDEGPQQRITIDRTLAVSKYEVTQGDWQAVMGVNPSYFKGCGLRCPVEQVSWDDVKEYLKKLNERTNNRYGYRLLSEAEWEYAARAGCSGAFSINGQCKERISASEANFDGNYTYNGSEKGPYRAKTIRVGSLNAANAWGLHDMHGNVWEWVEDCWNDTLSGIPSNGSARTSGCTVGSLRALRGGSSNGGPQYLRAAYRYGSSTDIRNNSIGFRVARTVNF